MRLPWIWYISMKSTISAFCSWLVGVFGVTGASIGHHRTQQLVGVPLLKLPFRYYIFCMTSSAILSYPFLLGTSPDTNVYVSAFNSWTCSMLDNKFFEHLESHIYPFANGVTSFMAVWLKILSCFLWDVKCDTMLLFKTLSREYFKSMRSNIPIVKTSM